MTSILVLDDEVGPRTLLAMALRDTEVEVETAATGAEALQLVEMQHFDWIISDVYLTDSNGIALTDDFRRLSPTTRVILISGLAGAGEIENLPIAGFWRKPFDPFDLRDFIRDGATRVN